MLPDAGLPADAALFTVADAGADAGGDVGAGDGAVVTATEFARGPWDERACHGGPVSAILVRAVEALGAAGPVRWQIARTTIELVRPVPVGVALRVGCGVERPGRNVSLLATTMRTLDGDVEVARARTLRIRAAEVPTAGAAPREAPFSPAGSGVRATSSWALSELTAFHKDAAELRFVNGSFADPGPCRLWCRLRVPVVAGEEPTGVQRAVAAADFANGVSGELDASEVTFVNPDLTVHLAHEPVGEWIGLDAKSHYGALGAGMSDTALYDRTGRIGRSVQSLFVAARA